MKRVFLVLLLVAALPAWAQQSASYRLDEHVVNAGGHPANGVELTSPSYRISLDALGNAVAGGVLAGPSYHVEGGFVPAYPPPGEVPALLFTGRDDLEWGHERYVGHYNLYRDPLAALPGLGYGVCRDHHLGSAAYNDPDLPGTGDGLFYLVTAVNRLGEEGPKGWDHAGTPRTNPSPCP